MWTALADAGIPVLENDSLRLRRARAGASTSPAWRTCATAAPTSRARSRTSPTASPCSLLAHDPDVFPYVPEPRRAHGRRPHARRPDRAPATCAGRSSRPATASASRAGTSSSTAATSSSAPGSARAACRSGCSRRRSCSCSSCCQAERMRAPAHDPDQPLLREGALGARAGRARLPRGAPRPGRQPDRVPARRRPRHAARADLRGGRARGVRGDPALRRRPPAEASGGCSPTAHRTITALCRELDAGLGPDGRRLIYAHMLPRKQLMLALQRRRRAALGGPDDARAVPGRLALGRARARGAPRHARARPPARARGVRRRSPSGSPTGARTCSASASRPPTSRSPRSPPRSCCRRSTARRCPSPASSRSRSRATSSRSARTPRARSRCACSPASAGPRPPDLVSSGRCPTSSARCSTRS